MMGMNNELLGMLENKESTDMMQMDEWKMLQERLEAAQQQGDAETMKYCENMMARMEMRESADDGALGEHAMEDRLKRAETEGDEETAKYLKHQMGENSGEISFGSYHTSSEHYSKKERDAILRGDVQSQLYWEKQKKNAERHELEKLEKQKKQEKQEK